MENYKEQIIEMLKNIENVKYLKMLYGFVKPIYEADNGITKEIPEYKKA